MLVVALALLLQLDPSLVPHQAAKPTLPKIDQHACPFEGCQFGKWTVRQRVRLYSTWRRSRRLLRTLQPGQVVTAITGVNITYEPGEIVVTAPIDQYGLKPGDRVFGYMNVGEGFFGAWFNGMWVDEFDGSSIAPGCSRDCRATWVRPRPLRVVGADQHRRSTRRLDERYGSIRWQGCARERLSCDYVVWSALFLARSAPSSPFDSDRRNKLRAASALAPKMPYESAERHMPWTCPACHLAIHHSDHEPTPRAGVTYRCHVCRLELVADVREGRMMLAPFREAQQTSVDSREAQKQVASDRKRPPRRRG